MCTQWLQRVKLHNPIICHSGGMSKWVKKGHFEVFLPLFEGHLRGLNNIWWFGWIFRTYTFWRPLVHFDAQNMTSHIFTMFLHVFERSERGLNMSHRAQLDIFIWSKAGGVIQRDRNHAFSLLFYPFWGGLKWYKSVGKGNKFDLKCTLTFWYISCSPIFMCFYMFLRPLRGVWEGLRGV